MRNPYEILGLDSTANETELTNRYDELKRKYSEDRFLEGEAGNEAARKLTELEDSWQLIKADLSKRANSDVDLTKVDAQIKAGNYDEAQRMLDDVKIRTAEWHYLQSIVYYKREWLTESRAQLATCVKLEPNNAKYSEALNRLDAVMGNSTIRPQNLGGQNYGGARQQDNMSNSLCRCCQIYICLDCCCTLMSCCR